MKKIILRAKAKALGLKRYFDGKPCPSGHIFEKLVANYTCIKCLKEKHLAHRRIKRSAEASAREAERVSAANGHHLPHNPTVAKNLGLNKYFTGKPCPKGHVAERWAGGGCVICQRSAKPKNVADHRAKKAKYAREWRAKNGDRSRKIVREKRKTDIQTKLRSVIRCRIKSALRGLVKSKSSIAYLGCSVAHARAHIEKQFKEGMTWENHAIDGWHIDHILPLASFDLTDEDQRRRAFHYTNLQPLWALENLIKQKKLPAHPAINPVEANVDGL